MFVGTPEEAFDCSAQVYLQDWDGRNQSPASAALAPWRWKNPSTRQALADPRPHLPSGALSRPWGCELHWPWAPRTSGGL